MPGIEKDNRQEGEDVTFETERLIIRTSDSSFSGELLRYYSENREFFEKHVLERLGFSYEGTEIAGILIGGSFRDHFRYAWINPEY